MRTRPAIASLRPYEPGKPAAQARRELGLSGIVKLASNEGPFGPFPAACEAIERAAPELNRYPERGLELRERLAERHRVAVERIALGGGADGIVSQLALAYLDPGDEAVMGWPSFVSYRLSAIRMGAQPVLVPLRDGAYDLDALAARVGPRTRLVYVCTPNNPTGGWVGREALDRFISELPEHVLAVVDQAYQEYVTEPGHPDVAAEHGERENVVCLRTFSKIYGLAGLRIGYAVAPPDVVDALGRVRNAFDTTELAHVAALASLDNEEELRRRCELNSAQREVVRAGLERLGMRPLPSIANFLCVEVGDGRAFAAALEREGVLVRPLEPFGDARSIRVTIGTAAENAVLLSALERCLQTA
jgi:histidinol-phosphate aminotransferase